MGKLVIVENTEQIDCRLLNIKTMVAMNTRAKTITMAMDNIVSSI
jgi:hypothetical protein